MNGKEVLRAIADGADPSEFEYTRNGEFWSAMPEDVKVQSLAKDGHWVFRRKPRTRVINGFTVPAPIQERPAIGSYVFVADLYAAPWFTRFLFHSTQLDHLWLSRGLMFSTKEEAIANAKAMCGIDPNGEA